MWASSSCPRTWTRRLWTLACSPTPALASMMPIQSSTSSMVTWSKALTAVSPSPPPSVTLGLDQLPRSCRPSWLGTPSRRRWDPQDETLPGLQGLPAPLQSSVPTERSSGEWKERLGLSAQAEKALVPAEGRRRAPSLRGLALARDLMQSGRMFTRAQPRSAACAVLPIPPASPCSTSGGDTAK